jgi:hypothetical protein
MVLLGLFSKEISDTDFWWHLKTGEYVSQTHSLPDPDPFAYTTASAGSAYPGEQTTRRFNLTHEWLAQVALYLVYRVGGFGGVVLFRSLLLAAFCGIAGLLAFRRCGGLYRSLGASFAAAATVIPFASDRPFLITFLFVAVVVAILEWNHRIWLWLLPAIMLVWANSHGGFLLGWLVMGVWSVEAIFLRLRGRPIAGDIRLWVVCVASVLVSGLNPNGFHVVQVLGNYRKSFLTSTLYEWKPPDLWPPEAFSVLLLVAAAVLLIARRKVRPADWLLFAAATFAALAAGRNTFLVGLAAPVLIAAYLPWKKALHARLQMAGVVLVAGAFAVEIAKGESFQFRAAEWACPAGAAKFILSHHLEDRMFNTYEYGGYLIWSLWPHQRVFIDGRALSESLFSDYSRIVENAHDPGSPSAQQLLDRYGAGMIVMNGFEYYGGNLYWLATSLADPEQTEWKLVFADPQALIFLRHPPAGMQRLDPLQVLDTLEAQCSLHLRHEPQFPGCAGALGQLFSQIEDLPRERRWLGIYLDHVKGRDPQAMQLYQKLLQAGN